MRLARDFGLSFHPDHVPPEHAPRSFLEQIFLSRETVGPYGRHEIFQRGKDRRPYNTLVGNLSVGGHECEVWAGDWKYETTSGSGKNRKTHTHRFSYFMLALPYPSVKTTIRPEGFFDRIGEFVGIDDIDFESDAFSRAFHVTGDDKRFAYDLCHPRMIELLMAHRPPRFEVTGISAGGRNWLLIGGSGTWSPDEFRRHFHFADLFIEQWPRHLVARPEVQL